MEIIPAIDIIEGKCVRLIKGDYKFKKIYSPDPLKIAQIFQKAGFNKLHLIDLEGARDGRIKNWQTIKKIAKSIDLEIEFGGGIKDEKDIKKLLSFGVNKVILGSLIFKNPAGFKKIIKKFGEKVIIAVDTKRSKIYYRGWQEGSGKKLVPFLGKLIKSGIKNIICTDIERDGTLQGPNFSLYRKLIKRFPSLNIIAAGGIRNIGDLKKLFKIGARGAVIGKAIYEKTLSLSELKIFLKQKKSQC